MITITSIITGITSLFFLLSGLRTYVSWRKQKNLLLKFFTIFLIFFGIQQMFFALGTGPFSGDPLISNWLWAIAHIFMFIAISYFIRFPIRLRFPHLEETIFKLAIFFSIIGIMIIFYSIPEVEPYLLENGIYNWKVPPLAGATIGIFTTISLLFSFGIFVAEGRKVQDKPLKIRSWLIALGILVFLIGGPMHNFITTSFLNFLADFLLIAGSLLMLTGVYWSLPSRE